MTDKPSQDTMTKGWQSETRGNSHQIKSKAEYYGPSDQVRHNDDNQRDNGMDVSTGSKYHNVD